MIARADGFPGLGGRTALVVDDCASVLRWVARVFRRAGWHALAAHSGVEALALWAREREAGRTVDLLVTDLAMPVMDGPALADALRARVPTLPVLALTGREDRQARWEADGRPGSVVLLKPVPPDRLLATAERLVRR